MRDAITSLGGGFSRFPETSAGFLARLRQWAGPADRGAAEELCRRYWKPVYSYVRAAWSKTNEDAKDLTQAFFIWLLEGKAIGNYAELGAFRKYLKVLLRRFVGHQETALRRLRRGGGVRILPLVEDAGAVDSASDPEAAFDRAWWNAVVDLAVDRVKAAHAGDAAFAVYEAYDLGAERPTYAGLASRLGISERDVKRHLFAVREELCDEIRAELARQTVSERDLREEWNALFGA